MHYFLLDYVLLNSAVNTANVCAPTGGSGSLVLAATPGGPPGQETQRAEGGEGRGRGALNVRGRGHQSLQRALPQGPGGPEGQREAPAAR